MDVETNQEAPRRELIVLLIGALFPAFVAAAQFQINFVLVRQACSNRHHLMLYSVTVIAILLTVAASVVAFVAWKRSGRQWPTAAIDTNTRVSFLAVWALLGNGIFLLLIIAQGIATIVFDACQR